MMSSPEPQHKAPSRSITVGADAVASILIMGDDNVVNGIVYNPIIILQQAGAGETLSREQTLDLLLQLSRARAIAGWRAAGVSARLAQQLADDPTVGAPSRGLAELRVGRIYVLEGHLGMGKSLMGERLHRAHIEAGRQDPTAPVPVWLGARTLKADLMTAALTVSRGLGDPRRQGAAVILDGLDEGGLDAANDLIEQARVLVHAWPATTVLLSTRPGPLVNEDERVSMPLLSHEEAEALVRRVADDHGSLVPAWPPSVRDAIRTPLFAVLAGTMLRGGQETPQSRAELLDGLVERGLRVARHATARPNEAVRTLLRQLRSFAE